MSQRFHINVNRSRPVPPADLIIRAVRDSDARRLIDLIDGCYREYEGCVLLVEEEVPDLLTPETAFATGGGRFWVAERRSEIIGSGGVRPTAEAGTHEIHRVYVASRARRGGLATEFCRMAEEAARDAGAERLMLFSDTRFTDAHRLYEGLGFARDPALTRRLDDASNSVEYYFSKEL